MKTLPILPFRIRYRLSALLDGFVSSIVRRVNFSRVVHVGGRSVVIPTIRGLRCPESEPWMLELLSRLLGAVTGAFIDVGVNVGQTLVKVKALDPARQWVGFEPNPACVFYVSELIRANRFTNCTLLPIGLFTEDRILVLDLYTEDSADSCASVIPEFRPDQRVLSQLSVPVFRFCHVSGMVEGRIGVVKIDVEGAELEVLQSMADVLARDRPVIVLEMLPVYSNDNKSRLVRQHALENILRSSRYRLLRIGKTEGNDYSGVTPIEEIGVHSDLRKCDYVAVPNEASERLTFPLLSDGN